jgi:hypothetical protein
LWARPIDWVPDAGLVEVLAGVDDLFLKIYLHSSLINHGYRVPTELSNTLSKLDGVFSVEGVIFPNFHPVE